MTKFDAARLKYKPINIKYLIIAETPPKSTSDRFFYFEDVTKGDSLFIHIIRSLYSKSTSIFKTKELRLKKRFYLRRLKIDGFYLIDSMNNPFEIKYSSSQKIRLIQNEQSDLLTQIKLIVNKGTKVVLISATVFKANYDFLIKNGINIIQKESIDFPSSGGQKKFMRKIERLKHDYQQHHS